MDDSVLEPTTAGPNKPWLGSSITDICKGNDRWSFAISPVIPAKYHHVLYEIPVTLDIPPKPRKGFQHWDDDHVRMPNSESNLFPTFENGVEVIKSRWKLICKALSQPITSSEELESAINSYNTSLPTFSALNYFFYGVLDESETEHFFLKILPLMAKLALRLPELLPSSIPLLKQNHNKSVSLSQLQIACLLANAFFCTFPSRKASTPTYPGVNFVRLFAAYGREKRQDAVSEKLKCLFNYFRRVTQKSPVGAVTFERKFVSRHNMPRWDTLESNLGNTRIHITSEGTIEDDGLGFLQVDFANKNVGGGVLGYGCVQEEIRFVLCPELLISRLFVEQLGNNEAVIVIGAERYSDYSGYGDTFVFGGNHIDQVPYDEYGRRKTSICIIDATKFNKTEEQFRPSAILRELNKAYVGFQCREKDNIAPVATGNWGCGAFRGSKNLKSIVQLMACTAANRDLVYYSFGEEEIRDQFYNFYLFLAGNRITIGQLWIYLCQFSATGLKEDQLFAFLQQAYFDSKLQPSNKSSIMKRDKEKEQGDKSLTQPSTSKAKTTIESGYLVRRSREEKKSINSEILEDLSDLYSEDIIVSTSESTVGLTSDSDEIIPNSQPEEYISKTHKWISTKKTKLSSDEIRKKLPKTNVIKLLELLDDESIESTRVSSSSSTARTSSSSKQSELKPLFTSKSLKKEVKRNKKRDIDSKEGQIFEFLDASDEAMDVAYNTKSDDEKKAAPSNSTNISNFSVVKETQVTKRKITDYFSKN